MLDDARLNAITERIGSRVIDETLIGELRREWDTIHFTYCSDDDVIGPSPVREMGGYNIYLVNSSEHCLALTNTLESATGLVIAEVEED